MLSPPDPASERSADAELPRVRHVAVVPAGTAATIFPGLPGSLRSQCHQAERSVSTTEAVF